jgi:hypothetical protein
MQLIWYISKQKTAPKAFGQLFSKQFSLKEEFIYKRQTKLTKSLLNLLHNN